MLSQHVDDHLFLTNPQCKYYNTSYPSQLSNYSDTLIVRHSLYKVQALYYVLSLCEKVHCFLDFLCSGDSSYTFKDQLKIILSHATQYYKTQSNSTIQYHNIPLNGDHSVLTVKAKIHISGFAINLIASRNNCLNLRIFQEMLELAQPPPGSDIEDSVICPNFL